MGMDLGFTFESTTGKALWWLTMNLGEGYWGEEGGPVTEQAALPGMFIDC